jgi:hypothetical protein
MRYRINLFILFLICFYSSLVVAQVGNKDGYIITLENDTLYGKVEYHNILKNLKECRFSDDKGTTVYTPSQIMGYGFVGDMYFISGVVENTFLQVLISGELSLYKGNSDFYLEKNGNEVIKLKYREKTDTIEGKTYTKEDLTWKGYVNILVYDCIQDINVLRNLTMDERNLTKLAIDYNICKGASYIDYLAKKPWTKVELGISSGITLSSININNKTGSYNYLPDNYISYDPSFGLIFILSSPRFMNRIAFQSEIEFIKSDFFSEIIISSPSSNDYHDTYIDLTTLSFPQSVRYTVIDKDYRLFINLGIIFANNMHWETIRKSELQTGNDVFTSSGQAFEIEKKQLGLWGGIGFQKPFDKFNAGVTFKYNRMNKFCVEDFNSNITRLSLSFIICTK